MGSNRPAGLIERIKAESAGLRGRIAAELASPARGFSSDTAQLLKFHGVIQYENRDERPGRRRRNAAPRWQFTLRVRPTGGRLSADQWRAVVRLSEELGAASIRLTSRQGLQLCGLEKTQLGPAIRRLARSGLTTFASAGDVNCNVMCCPAPTGGSAARRELLMTAERLAAACMPLANAYREIWFRSGATNDRARGASADVEAVEDSLYGAQFLPHKFKIGVALPHDNCVDVLAQDVGLLGVESNGRIVGFEMFVGGGLGTIPSVGHAAPVLALPFARVGLHEVVEVTHAVMGVYRDFGDRSRRSSGRLKHLIAAWGFEVFRERVMERLGRPLPRPEGIEISGRHHHLGWHRVGPDESTLGLHVPQGRLGRTDSPQLVAALQEVTDRFEYSVHLTPQQNLLLAGIRDSQRHAVLEILRRHSVAPDDNDVGGVRRTARACPALPSCRAAITEAERLLPLLVAEIDSLFEELGLQHTECSVCITGCPSGCTRSYLADLSIVGRTVEARRGVQKFAIYVGGDPFGTRLNELYCDLVPIDDVMTLLRPLLVAFKESRRPNERLGDFAYRSGVTELRRHLLKESQA